MKQVYLINPDYPRTNNSNITFCTNQQQFVTEVKDANLVVIEGFIDNFPLNQIESFLKFVYGSLAPNGRLIVNNNDVGMLLNLAQNRQIDLNAINQRLVGKKSYLNLAYMRLIFNNIGFKLISCTHTQNCGFSIEVQK